MPIYFSWFITALLFGKWWSNNHNLPQSGRLLYCVKWDFSPVDRLHQFHLRFRQGAALPADTFFVEFRRIHLVPAVKISSNVCSVAAATNKPETLSHFYTILLCHWGNDSVHAQVPDQLPVVVGYVPN